MTETTGTPVAMSADEVFNSLNDFDEIAIERAFGNDVLSLKDNPTRFLRALWFTLKRREGLKDPEAKKAAQDILLGDLIAGFEAAEADPESGEG